MAKKFNIFCIFVVLTLPIFSQQNKLVNYQIETSALASDGGQAPLWFTANHYGITSIDKNQAYLKAGVVYQQQLKRNWEINAGVDVVAGINLESNFWFHQAFADIAWKQLRLSIGSKERAGFPLMKSEKLSSGWVVEGMNSRPIPQIRAEISDFIPVPGTRKWLSFKGHLAYGWFVDGKWQEKHVSQGKEFVKDALYHSKSLALRIGNRKQFPAEFEFGILTTAQFGGKRFKKAADGSSELLQEYPNGFKEYLEILIPKQKNTLDNVEGNHLGSWNFAFNFYPGEWIIRSYLEHFFEDHSQMFWQYGRWKDGLLGVDVTIPRNKWISKVVWECIATKDQTGSILYDGVDGSFQDIQVSGCDNYYNHVIYQSWQYYGMGIGYPLIPGPIYNSNGSLIFRSNRIRAHHLGIEGSPSAEWTWRLLASFVRHWGTYPNPLDKQEKQFSGLAELTYIPDWCKGWSLTASFGIDRGNYLGNKLGSMISLRKIGVFRL